MNKKVLVAIIMVITMMFSSVVAYGAINWGNAVYISYSGQVVDSITVNGVTVNALYAPRNSVSNYDSDSTFCCAAFVSRFYSQVYGVGVYNLYPGNTPLVSSGGGYFYKTTTPKVGDIAGNSGHWAIVKAVNGNSVTLIEQNCWNTAYNSAMVGRVLTNESSYWYWRWSGNDGSSAPSVSYQNLAVENINTQNVWLYGEIVNPGKYTIPTVGVRIWDSNNILVVNHSESCNLSYPTIYQRLDLMAEAKADGLKEGETYTYQMWAMLSGVEYSSSKSTFTMAGTKAYLLGDIDNSGWIDSRDALLVLKYCAKLSDFNSAERKAADVDNNLTINAQDALIILKHAARIEIIN